MTADITREAVAKTAKGNTRPDEIWLTFWDIYNGDRTYLGGVNDKPWERTYDAPITAYADNMRYVPGDMLDVVSAERDTLQSGQTYAYIGKDGKTVLARDLEDERDALSARVVQLEAENRTIFECLDANWISHQQMIAQRAEAEAEAAENARLRDALRACRAMADHVIHGEAGFSVEDIHTSATTALQGDKP